MHAGFFIFSSHTKPARTQFIPPEDQLMKELFDKLYAGRNLSEDESKQMFTQIFNGKMSDVELSSLLTALKVKGESADEVSGAALAMLEAADKIKKPDYPVGEIVGTGGDGMNTFNISTISAILASCLGLHIAKHGNRAVSSKTGASDLLAALGYNINASHEKTYEILEKEGFAFIFAQSFHKAMKYAAPVRQQLKTRTIFNLLGPLTNPIHPDYELLGVYDANLCTLMANTLRKTGLKRALCVNGLGMDEIASFGTTHVAELRADGKIVQYEVNQDTFGFSKNITIDEIRGAEHDTNAKIAVSVLSGNGTDAQNITVAVNLGALVYLAGKAESLKEGFEMAMECIKSGKGIEKLHRVCQLSQEGAAAEGNG